MKFIPYITRCMLPLLLIVNAAFLCFACSVRADELVLTNGERLIGTLESMQDSTINFKSDMLGRLKIPLQKVSQLSVEQPRSMLLEHGESVSITVLTIEQKAARYESSGTEGVRTVSLKKIEAIDPPPRPRIAFSGNLSSGIVDTHGSSSSTKANLSGDLTIRTVRQRILLDTRGFYGREKDKKRGDGTGRNYVETDKNYSAGVRYDYFISEKLYSFLGTRYRRDTVANLKYRLITSTGLGYQWFETSALKFSTDAGIAQFKEKYVSRVNNPLYVPGGLQPKTLRKTRRVDDLAWQTGIAFDWRVNSRLALLSQMRYTQSFEKSSAYYLSTETELRLFLTQSFYSNLKTIFEYDNTPGAGSNSTETKHIFGLGWTF